LREMLELIGSLILAFVFWVFIADLFNGIKRYIIRAEKQYTAGYHKRPTKTARRMFR